MIFKVYIGESEGETPIAFFYESFLRNCAQDRFSSSIPDEASCITDVTWSDKGQFFRGSTPLLLAI
jgi:hypothetical protein